VARTLGDGGSLEREGYRAAFGCAVDDDYGAVVADLVGGGLLEDDGARLSLSETGRLLHDLVTLAFYPAHARRWLEDREAQAPLVRSSA